MRSEPGLEWLEDRKEDWTPLLASKLKFLHDGFAFIVICDDERSWFSEYIIKKINSSTNSRPLLPFFSLRSLYRGGVNSLEDALLEFPGCAVVISHDRWFLDRVATHMLAWEGEDEDGTPRWFWFEGNFADYETNKIERLGAEAARPHASKHRRLTR